MICDFCKDLVILETAVSFKFRRETSAWNLKIDGGSDIYDDSTAAATAGAARLSREREI